MLPSKEILGRLDAVKTSFEQAKVRRSFLAARLSDVEKDVGEAKFRLSLKDEVEDIILDIQERNHKRTVGMYESLLTQILQEVLQNKEKSIALELGTKAGKPTLDIMVSNGGMQEDIMSGSGGSVANIVSAGLRFIALSRIDCRKFIVLDEADCWLAPDRIAHFSNVVSQMGAELGVQSLMISHHDSGSFWDAADTVVYLSKGDLGGVNVEHQKESQVRVGEKDIALIELKDFMSHEHTIIKMGAGMTVVHGANDIGKSAVVTAMHAISEASFKKEYVRHGCGVGFIRLTLGNGQVIECQRNVKGSPAIIYRLIDVDGSVAHESPVKNEVPQWAAEMIGIRLEQDLDVQLGNQKAPVFLLDEPDSKKATILSVGGELSHLITMQEKYKAWVAADKLKVKDGEVEVGGLRRAIEGLDALLGAEGAVVCAMESIDAANKLSLQDNALSLLVHRAVGMGKRCAAGEGLFGVCVPSGEIGLVDVAEADRLLGLLRKRCLVASVSLPVLSFSDTSVRDVEKIERVAVALGRASRRVDLAEKLPAMGGVLAECPKLIAEGVLLSLMERIKSRVVTGKAAAKNERVVTDLLRCANDEYNALVQEMGGACPVCHGQLKGVHVHG